MNTDWGRVSQKGTKVTKGQNGDGELAGLVLGAPKAGQVRRVPYGLGWPGGAAFAKARRDGNKAKLKPIKVDQGEIFIL